MIRWLRAVARDCAGVAVIEFAFVLPVMAIMFCGVVEISQAVILYMKVIDAADTVSDLVAQQTQIDASAIDNYYVAAQLVMTPSPGGGLGLAVASVTFDNSNPPVPSVAWQVTRGGAAAMTDAATAAVGLGAAGESVIVAQTSYTYNSVLDYIVPNAIHMAARVFNRPRLVLQIPCPPADSTDPCS